MRKLPIYNIASNTEAGLFPLCFLGPPLRGNPGYATEFEQLYTAYKNAQGNATRIVSSTETVKYSTAGDIVSMHRYIIIRIQMFFDFSYRRFDLLIFGI